MFHMQSTHLLQVDSSLKSTVFFCSPLSVRSGDLYCTADRHLCLHCWHLL